MNYKRIYDNLIERAKNRITNGQTYYERHHIIPKCMNGTDDEDNLVDLLPEEHYISHLLLVKIYPDESKLIYAANMMANRNNKSYGWVKRKFAIQNSLDHTGMKHTIESKIKMSKSRKNVPKSERHKNNIRKKKLKLLEYKGNMYIGYDELKKTTGVSYHLYNKFYKNGIDPEPFIGNNTYAMIKNAKTNASKSASGKNWYNDGLKEAYYSECPDGWNKGRLKKKTKEEDLNELFCFRYIQ
jgi:hypothetical protein